jgi:hypothetical protein
MTSSQISGRTIAATSRVRWRIMRSISRSTTA